MLGKLPLPSPRSVLPDVDWSPDVDGPPDVDELEEWQKWLAHIGLELYAPIIKDMVR